MFTGEMVSSAMSSLPIAGSLKNALETGFRNSLELAKNSVIEHYITLASYQKHVQILR